VKQAGDRFFARIRSADLECPRCGNIYFVGGAGRSRRGYYDRKTSRFRCPHCGLVLVLGMIAWLPPLGRPSVAPDQVPTVRQALAMRRAHDAIWPEKAVGFREPANRLVEGEE